MKYKDYLLNWLSNEKKLILKEKTFSLYEKLTTNHIVPCLGDKEINKIRFNDIQNFINNKYNNTCLESKKSLSSGTIKLLFIIIKSSLKAYYKKNNKSISFISDIILPKSKEKEIGILSISDQNKLVNYCLNSNKKNYYGIVLTLYTGIRIGELLSLTFDDINFEYKYMRINKTQTCYLSNNKCITKITSTKTNKSNRIIPLNPLCIKLLKELKKDNSIYVILNRNNDLEKIRTYQKIFSNILKRLNIKHVGFHSLRHTFASNALHYGMDIKTLSEILGHSNVSITLNRYSHSMIEQKVKAMNDMYKKVYKNLTY